LDAFVVDFDRAFAGAAVSTHKVSVITLQIIEQAVSAHLNALSFLQSVACNAITESRALIEVKFGSDIAGNTLSLVVFSDYCQASISLNTLVSDEIANFADAAIVYWIYVELILVAFKTIMIEGQKW